MWPRPRRPAAASGPAHAATRTHAGPLVVGSLVAGVGAYAFQLLGTRSLGSVDYAPISVLWTLQYLTVSIALFAVETYLAREIAVGARPRSGRLYAD